MNNLTISKSTKNLELRKALFGVVNLTFRDKQNAGAALLK